MAQRSGQASIESLTAIVFILFVLTLVALQAVEFNRQASDLKIKTDTRRVCNSIADNINNIAEQGSGFYRYFSIPETLYGERDYNISIYGNSIEIISDNVNRIRELVTSNVTIICLDKGLNKKNKAYNEDEKIYIICHKPELMILNNSFRPVKTNANGTMNISVEVINFGPADAGGFMVLFNNTASVAVGPLKSEEKTEVRVTLNTPAAAGTCPMEIRVDSDNAVNESIESNNFHNATINVV
ncbi:MAG: hypothetical protein JW724_02290 [Candidatus Altiarchaeota archaeon]|nr:hypothetical protein [Candidatus Altiarchaeota archaeon]